MSALAAGMITTGELIGILQAAGISVTVAGVGAFIVRGVKVLAEELERMAKEIKPCLRCNHCTGFRPNLISAVEKGANVVAQFFGAQRNDNVAFRACLCGCHVNFHRGH